jgi:hypothetical protein
VRTGHRRARPTHEASGALAGIGLVALIVSAIPGSAGDPPRLEPPPSLRVGVAPLPGGGTAGVAASF